jgi:hypothetical protein
MERTVHFFLNLHCYIQDVTNKSAFILTGNSIHQLQQLF